MRPERRRAPLRAAVEERCATAGVDWVLVPSVAVARRLHTRAEYAGLPVIESVAAAEHQFDEVQAGVAKGRGRLARWLRRG